MNWSWVYSSSIHLHRTSPGAPVLWYNISGVPEDRAPHLKHTFFETQLDVGRHMQTCHSQSPRNSHKQNLWNPAVKGVPALRNASPHKAPPIGPVDGFSPWKAALKLQVRTRNTWFIVLFLYSLALGIVNKTNLEWRTLLGLKRGRLNATPICFSNLYCVNSRAPSPCRPRGMCWELAGLWMAHGSPISRECCQYSATSWGGISIPTSLNR